MDPGRRPHGADPSDHPDCVKANHCRRVSGTEVIPKPLVPTPCPSLSWPRILATPIMKAAEFQVRHACIMAQFEHRPIRPGMLLLSFRPSCASHARRPMPCNSRRYRPERCAACRRRARSRRHHRREPWRQSGSESPRRIEAAPQRRVPEAPAQLLERSSTGSRPTRPEPALFPPSPPAGSPHRHSRAKPARRSSRQAVQRLFPPAYSDGSQFPQNGAPRGRTRTPHASSRPDSTPISLPSPRAGPAQQRQRRAVGVE